MPPTTIIARVTVNNVEVIKDQDGKQTAENVYAHPVYSSDPKSPNYSFSQATPSGQIQMWISNPDAFGFFKLRGEYDVTFNATPAPVEPAAA